MFNFSCSLIISFICPMLFLCRADQSAFLGIMLCNSLKISAVYNKSTFILACGSVKFTWTPGCRPDLGLFHESLLGFRRNGSDSLGMFSQWQWQMLTRATPMYRHILSLCITFTNILLKKVSHMAKSKVKG